MDELTKKAEDLTNEDELVEYIYDMFTAITNLQADLENIDAFAVGTAYEAEVDKIKKKYNDMLWNLDSDLRGITNRIMGR